ncbi:MAG: TolC family protein [Candidatus Ratteibacteria bacterium]|nr:TolC family protein [Candidatus Ratteibacteria bacterium]
MIGKSFRIILVLILVFGSGDICFGKAQTEEALFLQTQKLYSQARDYYLRGELEKTRKELLRLIKLDPKDEAAREFLKMTSSELKKEAEKNDLFFKHYNLGKKYFRMKKWSQAKEELRAAVQIYPQHSKARQAIGLWDKMNRRIIRETKEEVDGVVRKKAEEIRQQEEEIAELKIKKVIAKKKKKERKKKVSPPLKELKRPEGEKPIVNLPSCIQIAILNSLPVKIAKKQAELAEMKLFESWRVIFPAVVGEISDTYGKTTESDYESRKRVLQFQQLIFDGGRSVFRLHQAKLGQKITQENFKTVKQKLVYQVKQAYYRLIHYQNVVKAQKALYEEAKKFLEMTEKQYKSGYVSRVEFLNIESKFNQVGYALVASQQALSLAKLKFQQVLSLDVPFALEIDTGLDYTNELRINLEHCLYLALRNRPEIKISQLSLAVSKYGEKIAKRKTWPELSLIGNIGESGEAYTGDILRMKDEWSVLGKLSWSFGGSSFDYSHSRQKVNPSEIAETNLTTEARTHNFKFGLLDDLEYFSKSKEAEIAFQKTMNDYRRLRQKVIMEVKEAYFLYERAKIMLEAVKSKIKYYQKEVEIAELRKSLDIIPLSALLEVKINLNEQEMNYAKAVMECYLALAAIDRAIGISFFYSYGRKRL